MDMDMAMEVTEACLTIKHSSVCFVFAKTV